MTIKIRLKNINPLYSKNNMYVKGSGHRVKFNISPDFALICGLLWGDGWIISREKAKRNGDWRIGLVEDDKGVIENFCILIEKEFNIKVKVRFRKTYYEVYFNSRLIYEILNQNFGFPGGYKFGKLNIPKIFRNSKKFIIPFLSGVFSTDGKFTIYKGYPRIGVESATEILIKQIKTELDYLGFNPKTYAWNRKDGNNLYGLYLNGKDQVKLFAKKINFIGDKNSLLNSYVKTI